jgi:ribosomal protein S18 acetylase RimI-like enzyme
MYTRKSNCGIGKKILVFLENEEKKYGYKIIRLETRKRNINDVNFYANNGYKIIQNYGKYINNNMAVCFEKQL